VMAHHSFDVGKALMMIFAGWMLGEAIVYMLWLIRDGRHDKIWACPDRSGFAADRHNGRVAAGWDESWPYRG
jgi:hypothetical protein